MYFFTCIQNSRPLPPASLDYLKRGIQFANQPHDFIDAFTCVADTTSNIPVALASSFFIDPINFTVLHDSKSHSHFDLDGSVYLKSKVALVPSVNNERIVLANVEAKRVLPPVDWILNCGGRVTCLDWCPTGIEKPWTKRQYLAIATSKTGLVERSGVRVDGTHFFQIWDMGILLTESINGKCSIPAPQLAFCIQHPGQSVLSLKWCPRGAYTPPSKIGLIAACCSDGSIVVVAVPDPENVPQHYRGSVLAISFIFRYCDSVFTPSCLSWSVTASRVLLGSGTTEGVTLVWDFSSLSFENANISVPPDSTLNDFIFDSPVMSLDFKPSPGQENELATLDIFGTVHVWDIRNSKAPITGTILSCGIIFCF